MQEPKDDAKIARVIGIFLSWAIWTAATAHLYMLQSGGTSLRMTLLIYGGFIMGNYAYSRLWMAEGRARERAELARKSSKRDD